MTSRSNWIPFRYKQQEASRNIYGLGVLPLVLSIGYDLIAGSTNCDVVEFVSKTAGARMWCTHEYI